MLRFIVSKNWKDNVSGAEGQSFETIDGDIETLERCLTSGGFGEDAYEHYHLVGVEIIKITDRG
jgi:hypothetical protein